VKNVTWAQCDTRSCENLVDVAFIASFSGIRSQKPSNAVPSIFHPFMCWALMSATRDTHSYSYPHTHTHIHICIWYLFSASYIYMYNFFLEECDRHTSIWSLSGTAAALGKYKKSADSRTTTPRSRFCRPLKCSWRDVTFCVKNIAWVGPLRALGPRGCMATQELCILVVIIIYSDAHHWLRLCCLSLVLTVASSAIQRGVN
jgi:hypothetical protein